MDVIITRHAKRKLRKRLGIPNNGQKKHVLKAFTEGKLIQPLENEQKALLSYKDFYYIFTIDKSYTTPILITAYPIPLPHLNAFDARFH